MSHSDIWERAFEVEEKVRANALRQGCAQPVHMQATLGSISDLRIHLRFSRCITESATIIIHPLTIIIHMPCTVFGLCITLCMYEFIYFLNCVSLKMFLIICSWTFCLLLLCP